MNRKITTGAVLVIILILTFGIFKFVWLDVKKDSAKLTPNVSQNVDQSLADKQQEKSSGLDDTYQSQEEKPVDDLAVDEKYEEKEKKSVSITLEKCGLVSKKMELLTTNNYNIFGESIFDTAVCGYLVKKVEPKLFTNDGSTQINPYFRIIEFSDDEFRQSIINGVDEGNHVNSVSDDGIDFNLGCLENGKISGIRYDEAYIDSVTEGKIFSSSEKKPVALLLSFGIHAGMGCICCNLAHKVRVID